MEDIKLYSTQDIERLKQKIAIYRETLTTLKKGTSIEDFLYMKQEFDGFKTQIAHLEGLTETIDVKQNMQLEEYEEKVKQISSQIDFLNQTVEEMNQEILLVLKKLILNDDHELTDKKVAPINSNTSLLVADHTLRPIEEIPKTKEQSFLTNTPPSYKQLQSLAGLAISTKKDEYTEMPVTSNTILEKPLDGRHFNQQYFQSIGTQPSHIYNGLYKNAAMTPSFHFKNASSLQEIPISIYDSTENPPIAVTDEFQNSSVEITHETEQTEPITNEYHEVQLESTIEEIFVQAESSSATKPEENKKDGISSFFNIFRRRH